MLRLADSTDRGLPIHEHSNTTFELDGENEVFEELEDDEVVSLVKSQGIDKSD
jgi:hypothetical protein